MSQPYRFAGGYQDPTGLYHFAARYYDPNVGRFTTHDPSGLETNPYLYADGDPVNRIDPTGLWDWSDFGADVLGGVLIGAAGGCASGAIGSIWTGPGALAGCGIGAQGKNLVQEHFRPSPALVEQLRADGKAHFADAVDEVADLSRRGHITYLDQHGPYGNGTPVLNASHNFRDEPMLVLWPDDVFVSEVPRAQQLIRA